MMMNTLHVGIDLGTTNTTCSVLVTDDGGAPSLHRIPILQLVGSPDEPNALGLRDQLPSVAWVCEDGHAYTGEFCKEVGGRVQQRPGSRIVRSIKRQMGNRAWELRVGQQRFRPRDISALFLETVLRSVEMRFPGRPVKQYTITIPASFSSVRRHETLMAARLAGMELERTVLVDEPVAALFSLWDLQGDWLEGITRDQARSMVFDMGGGTLDVSVIEVDRAERSIRVRATSRYNELAGDDIDLAFGATILQHTVSHPSYSGFLDYKPDANDDAHRLQVGLGLLDLGQEAKHELSSELMDADHLGNYADLRAQALHDRSRFPLDLDLDFPGAEPTEIDIPVADLLGSIRSFFTKQPGADELPTIFQPADEALERADLKRKDLHHLFLTGGAALFPPVLGALTARYLKEPKLLDPFFAVSQGAAVLSYLLDERDWRRTETMPDRVYLRRNGHPFLEVMPRVSVPAVESECQFDGEDCPFLRIGETGTIQLEFYQGRGRDDPHMTLAHVETLQLPRGPSGRAYLTCVKGSLDTNKVYRFSLVFTDDEGEMEAKVHFEPTKPAGVSHQDHSTLVLNEVAS